MTSVAQPNKFLNDGKINIVFSGKSNVGKSSVINKLLNRKNFARVSSVPGKTIHVNYFLVDKKFYLVDLPGYGYAKVSQSEKERWNKLMESYFSDLNRFDLGVLILDSRHKPTADDRQMKEWFDVPARNDSKRANSSAMLSAPASLQSMPFLPFLAKYLVLRSSGSILSEIIPARENIMDSSQQTPISSMNVVDSLLTDQSG